MGSSSGFICKAAFFFLAPAVVLFSPRVAPSTFGGSVPALGGSVVVALFIWFGVLRSDVKIFLFVAVVVLLFLLLLLV